MLWNDPKMRSEVMKPNFQNIYAIYSDHSLCKLYQAKQGTDQRCLPTTSPTNNSHFVPSFDCASDPLKNQRSIGLISNLLEIIFKHISEDKGRKSKSTCVNSTFTLRISSLPTTGQFKGGRLSSIISGASLGICMYCSSLSTEMIEFAIMHWLWTENTRNTFNERPYESAIPIYPAIKTSITKYFFRHFGVWFNR